MKNNFIKILLILILSLNINHYVESEEFIFKSDTIEIKDNGNIVEARNGVEIEGINNIMRMEDITKAQNSINFLNESTKIANIQSIKDAISTLLESQMKTLMLASSNDSYVFRVLDKPIVSEKKSGPARAIICILGTFIGTMLSLCFIFLNKIKKNYY